MKQPSKGISAAILIFTILISLLGLAASIVLFNDGIGYLKVVNIIVYILGIYYALLGYKKPHGNVLKYTFLIYAISLMIKACTPLGESNGFEIAVNAATLGLCAIIVAYMSGKLDRIKRNNITAIVIAVFILIRLIIILQMSSSSFAFFQLIELFSSLIQWAVLYLAYAMRYSSHRDEGLAAGQ